MNGAQALIRTAVAAGLEICFANPGTTEIPLVAAIDDTPGMRGVLGLFEGVCTGAADGYARMADKPALTLLHLGPGFANGIANLHNARRARTPIVNLIGEHASWHIANDPPLNSDIASLSGVVSGWVRTSSSADSMAQDMADAISAARGRQIATLIAPNDYQMDETDAAITAPAPWRAAPLDSTAIDAASQALRAYAKVAVILGGQALRTESLRAAQRIQAATGCDLLCEGFPGRLEWGAGLANPTRIPYFPELALPLLARYQAFVLVDAPEPVVFFGYPNTPGRLIQPGQEIFHIGSDGQDPLEALHALADALNAPRSPATPPPAERPTAPSGKLDGASAVAVLAACQPENAIIVNEGVSTGRAYAPLSAGAPPHTQLIISGGSIGFGIPCATGAALACPDRPVIDLQADGSALYTMQALWTQARENLNVTTLICANGRYQILDTELQRAGLRAGPALSAMTDLTNPPINWVSVGHGLGVPSSTARTADELVSQLRRALAEPGPHLIKMVL